MTPITIIIDGPQKRERAVQWLSRIPVDEVMELTLRAYKPTRSERQNKRYWLLIQKIAEHTGHDAADIHELMKFKHLGTEEKELGGEKITTVKSSAKLRVNEFKDYSDRVEAWAVSTLGVWLE
jgi:hypothetical protein